MTLASLHELRPPWVVTYEPTPSERQRTTATRYSAEAAGLCVVKLRGKKMRRVQQLMDEFGAALQFFEGFGENWHALGECLRYLDEWLPASGYVLVIVDPPILLEDQPQEREWLFRVLEEVGEWWSHPIADNGRFNREARPFHVVLECEEGTSALASAMWPTIGRLATAARAEREVPSA